MGLSIGSSPPSEDRPCGGPSPPAVSPSGGGGHPSAATQLLSTEAGRGPKSDAKESSGPPAAGGRLGARMTPARLLLGIHRARKSAWEKAGVDITMAGVRRGQLIWDLGARLR